MVLIPTNPDLVENELIYSRKILYLKDQYPNTYPQVVFLSHYTASGLFK